MTSDITVIIPIYNVEKYIAKCLTSLIEQTYTNFEILAIDDGSPDNSNAIVQEYMKKDSRIKLIEKENGGYGTALELAIKQVKTPYFLVCDPDDWLEKDAIEVMQDSIRKFKSDLVIGDRYDVYTDNNERHYVSSIAKPFLKIRPDKLYTKKIDIQQFSFTAISPHSKLYKTSLLRNVHFPRKVSFTDYLLYICALVNAKKVVYINRALSDYLIDRPGNTTTDTNIKVVEDQIVVWNCTMNMLDKHKKVEDILWYRMYDQVKVILSEYALLSNNTFKDKLTTPIYDMISTIQTYKHQIKKIKIDKDESQLLKLGLMNKLMFRLTAKSYVKAKQIVFNRK